MNHWTLIYGALCAFWLVSLAILMPNRIGSSPSGQTYPISQGVTGLAKPPLQPESAILLRADGSIRIHLSRTSNRPETGLLLKPTKAGSPNLDELIRKLDELQSILSLKKTVHLWAEAPVPLGHVVALAERIRTHGYQGRLAGMDL
jgi:hypothetical protein